MEVEGAFEKKYKDEMVTNEGKKLDFIILWYRRKRFRRYLCFYRSWVIRPAEASDDHHLTGTTVSVQTVPKWIEDNYDVAVTEDDQAIQQQSHSQKKGEPSEKAVAVGYDDSTADSELEDTI